MNKKEMKEYDDKYSHIPKSLYDRALYLFQELKMTIPDIRKVFRNAISIQNAAWDELNFVFYTIPKATPRARLSPRTKTFYVKNASKNHELFKEFIEGLGYKLKIITTSTIFTVKVYLPTPSTMNRIDVILAEMGVIRPVSTPDWDNVGKTYSDMIQKTLLLDDSLIITGTTEKYYSIKPRVEISLRFMRHYDSLYNKRKVEKWSRYVELGDAVEESHIIPITGVKNDEHVNEQQTGKKTKRRQLP